MTMIDTFERSHALQILAFLVCLLAVAAAASDGVVRHPIPNSSFPIAQAVEIPADAKLVYVSGQGPDVTNEDAERFSIAAYGDTETQTVSTLAKIDAILTRLGLSMGDVVKMQVYLVGDPRLDFAGFMRGYTRYFGTDEQPNLPARSAMQVAALANPGWLVEIEVVAVRR